ncbi:hypothetical protein D3C76_1423230 [compost metagenome]
MYTIKAGGISDSSENTTAIITITGAGRCCDTGRAAMDLSVTFTTDIQHSPRLLRLKQASLSHQVDNFFAVKR